MLHFPNCFIFQSVKNYHNIIFDKSTKFEIEIYREAQILQFIDGLSRNYQETFYEFEDSFFIFITQSAKIFQQCKKSWN